MLGVFVGERIIKVDWKDCCWVGRQVFRRVAPLVKSWEHRATVFTIQALLDNGGCCISIGLYRIDLFIFDTSDVCRTATTKSTHRLADQPTQQLNDFRSGDIFVF